MVELDLAFEDGRCMQKVYSVPLTIGRDSECGLQLKSWRVARQHARLVARGSVLFLDDLGSLAGTFVNGRRVTQQTALNVGDEMIVGPCRASLVRWQGGAQAMSEPAEVSGDTCASSPSDTSNSTKAELIEANRSSHPQNDVDIPDCLDRTTFALIRRRLHKSLVDALDLRRRDILGLSDEALRREAAAVLSGLLDQDNDIPPTLDRIQLLQQVVDEAVGLGPLEPLLADRSVTEIMVNAHEEIYIERAGRLIRHEAAFSSEQAVIAVIDRIVAPLGRRIDESSPMVDARLKDGSRVNAVIPPVALRGASLTIRKFPERQLDVEDLIHAGSLDQHMAAFLAACVARRKSVVVSGGTGSGKTTLLNVLSHCIPVHERIITIEDAAELRLNHAHRVALESRPANAEGKGRIEIRDLVRNALRMRPDRIIVGECRGAEAFDMLSAMNTGHEGSLTTLHANTPRDALARLETMILMAGMDLPLTAVREHIASAIDIIVQQARLSDGRRLVTGVVEVTGMEGGRIQTQDLFRYHHDVPPRFEGCGIHPECFTDEEQVPLSWLTQTTHIQPCGATQVWHS